ncbi:MAG: helix-hairpin-helix domain-containing protein [Lachnospiraceae bacterium]|nr:helix-hairpin-helix domain-containing protein [Lachnospiraceae bacterium]
MISQAIKTMARRAVVLLLVVSIAAAAAGCGTVPVETLAAQTDGESPDGTAFGNEGAGAGAEASPDAEPSPDAGEAEDTPFVVYVCGAVRNPGVYELAPGARICEAVDAAGGFTGDADETSLNLAASLEDGAQITVLTKEERAAGLMPGPAAEAVSGTSGGDGKVNLNTADKSELMTLCGIGEAKAEAIIRYREENGPFSSVEEIMQVGGIKDGLYEKVKDHIAV